MEKISIVVPVYNVERYIDRCINSLINQTYNYIEVIMVDDGSTDNSGKICDNYSKVDMRIKVIHKDNGGLSDARNVGLNMASGKYVLFVDSDDYISEGACQKFISAIGNDSIDLAMGDMTRIYSNTREVMEFNNHLHKVIITGTEFLKLQMENNSYNASACRNLYNREFLLEYNLLFSKGLLHEDEEWLPRVLLCANRIKITGINYYNYFIREDSITQKKIKVKNAIDLLTICKLLEKYYKVIDDKSITRLTDEYILKLYFNAFFTGRLYRSEFHKQLDDNFLKEKAHTVKMHLQVLLYKFNKELFYGIYYFLS